jgi:hypothetical protein
MSKKLFKIEFLFPILRLVGATAACRRGRAPPATLSTIQNPGNHF